MKKLLFFLILSAVFICKTSAQFWHKHITFEDTLPAGISVFIDTTSITRWQIGHPQKTYLNTTYNGQYAIMTDTINPYSPDDSISFIIRLIEELDCNSQGLRISFYSRYQTDTLEDYGILEYSMDSINWQRSDASPLGYCSFSSGYGTAPVTGSKTNAWETGLINFHLPNGGCFPELCEDANSNAGLYLDTVYFRFTLATDSLDTGKEGWLIDEISIMYNMLESVAENDLVTGSIYPNPAAENITIILPEHVPSNCAYIISDIYGRSMKQGIITSENTQVDISGYPNGIYFIRLMQDKTARTFSFVKD